MPLGSAGAWGKGTSEDKGKSRGKDKGKGKGKGKSKGEGEGEGKGEGKGKGKDKGKGKGEAKSERAIPTPPEGLSRQELREWFGRIQDRLDMAVESGRMTREEAREMIMRIRSNMR